MLVMQTVHDMANTLGRAEIARRVGVGSSTVSTQLERGHFPASWFDVMEVMCVEKGEKCPRRLFNFKSPADAPASGAD